VDRRPQRPQYEISRDALERLSAARDARGRRFKVHKLVQPGPLYTTAAEAAGVDAAEGTKPREAGVRMAASYVNFYVGTRRIVVPLLDPKRDGAALRKLKGLFRAGDRGRARARNPARRRQRPLHHPAGAGRAQAGIGAGGPSAVLHEALSGRRLTKLEYEHELPKLQDRLLDAQFELRKARPRAVVVIVTGIPGAGRSEVVNELLGWLDPKFVTVYGFREPNEVEQQRPPLWRYWRVMPPKGRIGILHAGWYGDFLSASVRKAGRDLRQRAVKSSASPASSACWWPKASRW